MATDTSSQQQKTIGLGILGAAHIAKKQCRSLRLIDSVKVVAVGSRDVSKAQAFIDDWLTDTGAHAYGSYEAVLADPQVDAVYIPLPTTLHLEWVRRAATAGKHVLLEKPIAATPADTDAILAVCAAHNVQFMDGTMWMHHPRTREMEAVLRSGKLGPIREVTAAFSFAASPEFIAKDIRFKKDAEPLGALGDLGWYCVRGILWAFNWENPTEVQAHAGATLNDEGVPITLSATLVFSEGRRGIFTCSFDCAFTQTMEIAGPEGTLAVERFVIPGAEREAGFRVTRDHVLRDQDSRDDTQCDSHIVHHKLPQEALMWEKFAECIRNIRGGEGYDPWWPKISMQTQKIVLAVLESAQNGYAVVPIPQSKI